MAKYLGAKFEIIQMEPTDIIKSTTKLQPFNTRLKMKMHMIKFYLIAVFIYYGATFSRAEKIIQVFPVPILTVRNNIGQLNEAQLRFTRNVNSSSPLSISVVEDTPLGSGDSLRASIWLSAMVAALEVMDPMQGTEISFSISGMIDGDSAGIAFAISIISAIEGRTIPDDVAFTGSILPDGSVGRVGGIPQKIMAARFAGKKRIIVPACLHIENVEGNDIDLKMLTQLIGLEYIPVASIREAYAATHKLELEPEISVSEINLPESVDNYYRQQYQRRIPALRHFLSEISSRRITGAVEQEIIAQFIEQVDIAENSAIAGYYEVAANASFVAFTYWSALNETLGFKPDRSSTSTWEQWDNHIKLVSRHVLTAEKLLNECLSNSPFPASFANLGNILGGDSILFFEVLIEGIRDELLMVAHNSQREYNALGWFERNLGRGLELDRLINENIKHSEKLDILRLFIIQGAVLETQAFKNNFIDFLPFFHGPYRISPDAAIIRNLFMNASLATTRSFEKGFIEPLASSLGIPKDMLYLDLLIQSPEVVSGFLAPDAMHEILGSLPDQHSQYVNAVFSQIFLNSLSIMAGRYIAFTELDMELNEDNEAIYKRSGLLQGMIRNAREQALRAISNCRESGLPWFHAAISLRMGDYSRDRHGADRVNHVLVYYWHATLQAKATQMLLIKDADGVQPLPLQPTQFIVRVKELGDDLQQGLRHLQPGDVILSIDGIPVQKFEELITLVRSMPQGYEYQVVSKSKDGTTKMGDAVGGRLLGLFLEQDTE